MFVSKIVGQHHTNAGVGFSMWRSGETVSRYFNIVLFAMGELAREPVYMRSTDTHAKITSILNRFYPYFKVYQIKICWRILYLAKLFFLNDIIFYFTISDIGMFRSTR
jgi:hypothetical protein